MTLHASETNWTAPLHDYGTGVSNGIQTKNGNLQIESKELIFDHLIDHFFSNLLDDQLAYGINQLLSSLGELKSEVKDLKLEIKELKEEARRSDIRDLKESAHKSRMDELEKEMRSLKMELEQLQEKKKEMLKTSELVFNFDLDEATSFFEPIMKGSNRHSRVFHVGGLPWLLYAELKEEKRNKYIGLYLRSENIGETAGTWAVNVAFELRLLTSSGNVIKKVRFCNRYDRCTSYGQHHFVSYDELKRNGLIEKDRVKLQVYVHTSDRK